MQNTRIHGEDISKSIILVGNSPLLLEENNGDIIDQFYKVVRIGMFVIDGFEKHVGTRADYNITRTVKYRMLSEEDRNRIGEVILIEQDSLESLGRAAINWAHKTFNEDIYITGFTENFSLHVIKGTPSSGKYYKPEHTPWVHNHNIIEEDIYISKCIQNKTLKVL